MLFTLLCVTFNCLINQPVSITCTPKDSKKNVDMAITKLTNRPEPYRNAKGGGGGSLIKTISNL